MKIKILGNLKKNDKDEFVIPCIVGKGNNQRTIYLEIEKNSYSTNQPEPYQAIGKSGSLDGVWMFRNKALHVERSDICSRDEIILRIKHRILHEENKLKKIARDIKAFENLEKVSSARRERIPESIRLFVWQRDKGQCVKCSSRDNLEFDHIIPISLGGSNTERNIQLLCERCNREKGGKI